MSGYVACRKLEYSQHGIPAEVVELREERLNTDLRPGQVLVRTLACPVNPADINTIQVTYNQKRFSPIIYDIEYRKQCIRSGSCLDPHSVGQ
jgi:trans-2-enoyl-CoA reductase